MAQALAVLGRAISDAADVHDTPQFLADSQLLPLQDDKRYRRHLAKQFNVVTSEDSLKWNGR